MLKEVCTYPLTLSQFHILKVMTFTGEHHVGKVAEFLGVSPPAATKNIDKLERLGLVLRTPCEGDRRAILLTASPEGRRVVWQYEELKLERLLPVLDCFRPDEIETLSDLLERFSVSLLDRERTGRGYCLRCGAYIEDECPVGRIRGGCPHLKAGAAPRLDREPGIPWFP